MEKTFTLRVYKNEYDSELIYQIEHDVFTGLRATDESTDKVLIVCGTWDKLNLLVNLIGEHNHDVIKVMLPEFITKEEQEKTQKEAFMKMYNELRNSIIETSRQSFCTSYARTKENSMMIDLFVQMKELIND